MATIAENLQAWNRDWPGQGGDEWSRVWGGPSAQWFGTILPRLKSYVPAATILEIAPGYGRWTQFLRPLADRLVLVDLSARCIDACRRRFTGCSNIEYHVNDGVSLAMIADRSIDLAFSFDSLVHAEADVLSSYLAQLAAKLRSDGVAFIHHSNFAECAPGGAGNAHWRAASVSAEIVQAMCEAHGLACVTQELINWGQDELNDAITVAALRTSRWAGRRLVIRNHEFMREASYVARLAQLYDWTPA